jgi:hypothetical protein
MLKANTYAKNQHYVSQGYIWKLLSGLSELIHQGSLIYVFITKAKSTPKHYMNQPLLFVLKKVVGFGYMLSSKAIKVANLKFCGVLGGYV